MKTEIVWLWGMYRIKIFDNKYHTRTRRYLFGIKIWDNTKDK